jgi:hypothetical protein
VVCRVDDGDFLRASPPFSKTSAPGRATARVQLGTVRCSDSWRIVALLAVILALLGVVLTLAGTWTRPEVVKATFVR